MTKYVLGCLLVTILFCSQAMSIEVATGKMLGHPYNPRAFYVRTGDGPWQETYSGKQFNPEAAGKLMNLRIANGIFEDDWLTEVPFNPEKNTERLIKALDTYKNHGILAISVSLQGGNAAYDRVAHIHRGRSFKLGRGKGRLTSAFRADGSLKSGWMARALRLQRALNSRGMILDLIYFYQGQDTVLENPAAINHAVVDATDWLIKNNCRNVIIEIANEFDVPSYGHSRYIFEHMAHLIELAREQFRIKHAVFRLPISASMTGPQRTVYKAISREADLTIIHGNRIPPAEKRTWVTHLFHDPQAPGPIYMDEDNNGRETTTEHLARELASCDAVFQSGGSWGYMPWVQVQNFPFRYYLPSKGAHVTDDMPTPQRDRAYFEAVLDHIRHLVYAPAVAAKPRKSSLGRP